MKLTTRTIHFAGDNTAPATQTPEYLEQRKNIFFFWHYLQDSLDSGAEPQSAAHTSVVGRAWQCFLPDN